jgi:hypothetical protein
LCAIVNLPAQGLAQSLDRPSSVRSSILGEAILFANAGNWLENFCDDNGPRVIGTPGHATAMAELERSLRLMGYTPRRQNFSFQGWERGQASVRITEPFKRELRAVSLGYVGTFSAPEAEVVYVDSKDLNALDPAALTGKILLLKPNLRYGLEDWHTLADWGVLGGLMINRVDGGQLLARTTNHGGESTPLPVFSITSEEGHWMRRLIEKGTTVRAALACSNQLRPMQGTNLIATLPGTRPEKIVLGAHFDSWDLGQGAIDNGLGVVQVLETAKLLKRLSPRNTFTIEFVWFDAEEFGLWGSRRYTERPEITDVRAMLNLDMVGTPVQVNAMGFDALVPILDRYNESLGAWKFDKPTANKPWLGSDHQPFILKGIPAITFNAPIDPHKVRFYHDFGDTVDKIDTTALAESIGWIALLIHHLANDSDTTIEWLPPEQTEEMLTKAGLKDRLIKSGHWPFSISESSNDPAQ